MDRLLRVLPPAVWIMLPGLAALAATLWLETQSSRVPGLRAELSELSAKLEELAEVGEANEELKRLKRELTSDIEMISWYKRDVKPLHPSLETLFELLPRELVIERLLVERPAWRVRLDLADEPADLDLIVADLQDHAAVQHVGFLDPSSGGPALHVEIFRPEDDSQ